MEKWLYQSFSVIEMGYDDRKTHEIMLKKMVLDTKGCVVISSFLSESHGVKMYFVINYMAESLILSEFFGNVSYVTAGCSK